MHMKRSVFAFKNPKGIAKRGAILLALSCLSLTPTIAADYYFLPTSTGSADGSDFANAYGWADYGATGISDFLNNTMGPGDRMLLGSGTFNGKKLTIDSSGTSGSPKEIVGIDTGSGQPLLTKGSWSRNTPGGGNHSLIQFEVSGVGYWNISGISISGAQHGIYSANASASIHNIHFNDITISDVRYGIYLSNLDNSTVENVRIVHYTKHAFRLEKACSNVAFIDCVADLTNGDTSWWDYSEKIPFGFNIEGVNGANSNLTFTNCIAMNNRTKRYNTDEYWNGDGFSVENPNNNLSFVGCLAFDNDDAGFDVKPEADFTDCVSFGNKRNFRLWYDSPTITNSVAGYAKSPGGTGSIAGVWVKNASATLDFMTIHGDRGNSIHEDGSGSVSATNSLLSFIDATGTFTVGSVTLDSSTETYRPGSGTDPDYTNDSASWDGEGNDFNSQTYGAGKGYFWGSQEIILDSEDTAGITLTGNWLSSSGSAGYYGSNYLHDSDNGKGNKTVRYTPTIPTAGYYEVSAMWTAHSNRATNTPIDINHNGETHMVSVNQRNNGGIWVSLGIYYFAAGTSGNVLISNAGTNGYVIADAVKFEQTTPAEIEMDSEDTDGSITTTGTWVSSTGSAGYLGSGYLHDNDGGKGSKRVRYTPDITIGGDYEVFAIWTANANRATNTPIDINYNGGTTTVTVNQRNDDAIWVSLGTYTFAAGTSGYIEIRNDSTNGYVIADGIKLVQAP